jgi:hypothetical protein
VATPAEVIDRLWLLLWLLLLLLLVWLPTITLIANTEGNTACHSNPSLKRMHAQAARDSKTSPALHVKRLTQTSSVNSPT